MNYVVGMTLKVGNITPHPLSKSNFKPGSNNNNGESNYKRVDERKTFGQIKDDNLGHNSVADEFITKGTITLIKHENNIWYNACPTPKCGKKVSEADGKYFCAKCNQSVDQYEPRYMISLSTSDHTGGAWVNAFNEVGKTILQNTDANTMMNLKENNVLEYETVFQKSIFKQYKFKIRAKAEEYQGVSRVRCNVFNVEALNFAEESRWLIQQIRAAS